jgi:phosphoglycolate phosphatase-like HAD superfamily hydrolase
MKCFIFDLDGTLADNSHRWHHVSKSGDWDSYYAACPADKPIQHIIEIARALYKAGFKIAIVTGRSETIREETVQWLLGQGILYDELIMRKKTDRRRNSELKLAALDELKLLGYLPLMVFEDLPAAVQTYRRAGVPCAQVADPEEWDLTHS